MRANQMDPMEASAREAQILEYRSQRMSLRQIAQVMGLSHQRVDQIIKEVADRIPAQRLADLRAEESELADRAIGKLLVIAENDKINPNTGNPLVSPRTRVEAWGQVRQWSESKRKLFGADAPSRREVTVVSADVIDKEIERLTREMDDQEAATRLAGGFVDGPDSEADAGNALAGLRMPWND